MPGSSAPAVAKEAASTSQMGRFETEVLTGKENLAALADLSGRSIDAVHARRPTNVVVLDMDSSVSPTMENRKARPTMGISLFLCPPGAYGPPTWEMSDE